MGCRRLGSSLVGGHPQGPTLTRVLIAALEEAVDLGGGRVLAFRCAAGDVGIAALPEVAEGCNYCTTNPNSEHAEGGQPVRRLATDL